MIKNILIVGDVWPEPNSSAAGSRMLQLIQLFLTRECKVVFASAAAFSEHRFDLGSLGVTEKAVVLNCTSFDEFVTELQPDMVLFDRFFTEEQFGWRVEQAWPTALRVLDTEDLHSLRHVRHQLLRASQKKANSETDRNSVPPVSADTAELYSLMSCDETAQREMAAIYRCDLSLIISEFEMRLLHDYFAIPQQLLWYCPLLAGAVNCASNKLDFSARQHFIAIGNFRHEPTWDSVLWLKYQLWPGIRALLPQAELHVYGAYPPPNATQLHNPKQGFYIKGWAENAQEVMCSARVCLAPLRFGAGIKGKLIDAMQACTPSVTTAIGAEAMCFGLPWAGTITDTAESFIAAAVELYQNPSAWSNAQENASVILRDHFSCIESGERLWARLASIDANLAGERQQNFVGKMLRNQYHQSLRYKSQWIEAKNRH
jgi:hypothetical protein